MISSLVSSDVLRPGTYVAAPLRHRTIDSAHCHTYFTILYLFHFCAKIHFLDYLATIWAGVAGCLMLPTVTFGVLANSLLGFLLAFKVKRPGQMQTYAMFIAIFDALFLIQGGYFFAFLTFGRPWWGIQDKLVQQTSHHACKIFNLIFDFLQAGKNYLLLIMVLHILRMADRSFMAPTLSIVIWAQIMAALAITVILASPSGLVFGLVQHTAMFDCMRDPQWAEIVQLFHFYHTNFFLIGLIPNVLTLVLLGLVWRRFHSTRLILTYLRNVPLNQDPVGLTVSYVECHQLDWLRNYRILLLQALPFCVLRIVRSLGKLCYIPLVIGWTNYRTTSAGSKVTMMTNTNAPLFFELILSSFPFIIWYANVPQIRAHCESGWLRFTCRWTPRLLRRYRRRLDPGSYLDQALARMGDRRVLRMKCEHVFRQLRQHELDIRARYDSLASTGKDCRGISWCDSSTIMTSSSFPYYGPKMSLQSSGSEFNPVSLSSSIGEVD